MTDLKELIQYWKDELAEGRLQHYNPTKAEKVTATIAYLERLNETWKGKGVKQ